MFFFAVSKSKIGGVDITTFAPKNLPNFRNPNRFLNDIIKKVKKKVHFRVSRSRYS